MGVPAEEGPGRSKWLEGEARYSVPNDDAIEQLQTRPIGQIEEQRETEAIEGDRAELNQSLKQIRAQASPLPLQRQKISIYRMEDPLGEPLVLGELMDIRPASKS